MKREEFIFLLLCGALIGSGCALTTPDGYSVVIDAEQAEAVMQRIDAYLAAREAAEARGDAEAAARWQALADALVAALEARE